MSKTVRPALTASFLFHPFILTVWPAAVPSSHIHAGVPLLHAGFNVNEGQNRVPARVRSLKTYRNPKIVILRNYNVGEVINCFTGLYFCIYTSSIYLLLPVSLGVDALEWMSCVCNDDLSSVALSVFTVFLFSSL